MSNYTYALEEAPEPADLQRVRDGLLAYNRSRAPDDGFMPLTILARGDQGEVVAGLLGATYWGWLVIEILWLDEQVRGAGLGSQMLLVAEQEGRQRGCHGAHLDTMSFQALPFYQKHGYQVFGVIEDIPIGHNRYFLKKALSE